MVQIWYTSIASWMIQNSRQAQISFSLTAKSLLGWWLQWKENHKNWWQTYRHCTPREAGHRGSTKKTDVEKSQRQIRKEKRKMSRYRESNREMAVSSFISFSYDCMTNTHSTFNTLLALRHFSVSVWLYAILHSSSRLASGLAQSGFTK